MTRVAELDPRLPEKGAETGLEGKEQRAVVYQVEKQDMTVTLFSGRGGEPVVELALGTEARSFSLSEFIHFWLTIIEVGLASDFTELEAGEVLRRIRRRR
jgi:hypothetical protein